MNVSTGRLALSSEFRKTVGLARSTVLNGRHAFQNLWYTRQRAPNGNTNDIANDISGRDAILVTVAFNSPCLIDVQLRLLADHFSDSYSVLIADNSSGSSARIEIEKICRERGATYISLPKNRGRSGSFSHAFALNWIYRNVLRKTSCSYYGFLDHDIFPIRPVSYRTIIERQGSYGHFQGPEGKEFYWPGLCFFSRDFFERGGADFSPVMYGGTYADTGAKNWARYYRHIANGELRSFTLRDVWATNLDLPYEKRPSDQPAARLEHFLINAVTLFDEDWVHLVNGSDWAELKNDAKFSQVMQQIAK